MGANVLMGDEEALAHRTGLRPVRTSALMGGFNNILRKELKEWFRPRSVIMHAVIWMAIINGLVAFVLFVVPMMPTEQGQPAPEMDLYSTGITLFFSMLFQAGAVGAIVSAQDEIVGEKQTGTAAWILSKPVARPAFVLAKLVANCAGILVFIVALTSVVGYVEITRAANRDIDVLPYLGGVGLVSLGLLYFLSLTMMLGTLFDRRGPIVGITLGVLGGGQILSEFIPELGLVTPVRIHSMAAALTAGVPLPANWTVTVLITVLSIFVFSGVAVWRFGREEF